MLWRVRVAHWRADSAGCGHLLSGPGLSITLPQLETVWYMYRTMNISFGAVPLLFLLLGWSSSESRAAAIQAGSGLPAAQASSSQALGPGDAQAKSTPSFRLVARLLAYDSSGNTTEGVYGLLWRSPTSWRDETHFAGLSQLRVAAGNTLFLSRNTQGLSAELFQLLNMADLLRTLAGNALEASPGSSSADNAAAWSNLLRSKEISLGEFTYNLNLRIPVHLLLKKRPAEFQFDSYLAFRGHQIPGVVLQLDRGKVYLRLEVGQLAETITQDSSFEPPKDAYPLPWCPNSQPAQLQGSFGHDWHPEYNPPRKGFVLYGIVGTEGKWHSLTVVRPSEAPSVDWEFIHHTILRQLFYPATCGKEKVVEEQVIEFLPWK